ncbi:MAG TPA: hypothetical protein VF519_06140 [Mycobacteriales bacterium]|jgi:hypothetical protein
MRRLVLAPAVALALLTTHVEAAPPAPQVTDPSGDANFGANGTEQTTDQSAGAGSQDYADVVSVLWQSTKTTKKVKGRSVTTLTGFTVTATLAGAPTPPAPTSLVFRMLGSTPKCGFFGVVYYTSKSSDPTIPQSALRDNCVNETTRLTEIAAPVIQGNTITWTVPMSKIPADTGVRGGTKVLDLFFEVRELQDFRGVCLPSEDQLPEDAQTGFGGACGLATGIVDNSAPAGAAFVLG